MKTRFYFFVLLLLLSITENVQAQHSVAREWNEMQLTCIRKDLARPTVQARNLFHVAIAMYDAWAAYDSVAKPYLLGDTVGGYYAPFAGVPPPSNLDSARDEAISYAAYRLIKWRYRTSPGIGVTGPKLDSLFLALGYDSSYHSFNYVNGNPADLGNYIAEQLIAYGLQDGANEANAYANQYYTPRNPTLLPVVAGNPNVVDPNLWQPLTLNVFIDQNGNVIPVSTPPFQAPEWGNVTPFALTDSNKTVYSRGGHNYNVYRDPGAPPQIDTVNGIGIDDPYKWTHTLTSTWSSHLDPTDGVMLDVSPASIGNAHNYPTTDAEYPNFYDMLNGGDNSTGYAINPKTGQPYATQIVPRGDYTRVLAEFWADGPSSETPPGHWYGILNYVNDHPQFEKRWGGKGPLMDELEWNVKSYFALGGATHDAAICAWGIKGWYDSARPITAIRYMADQGQSTDTTLANYSPAGLPLIPDFVDVVRDTNDALAVRVVDSLGNVLFYRNVGKIKIKAWKGPDYIANPATDVAGVDWILAENWYPYQRPTFVTPPFAGFISGHSTYSRTAAEVMTLITGDEYFPGGMGEFHATANQYLVFEEGPSVDVTLQWAKYNDASDQCSLSRIWGGIHPPADDIPGRLLGQQIGPVAFHHAVDYFDSEKPMLTVTRNMTLINDPATLSTNLRFEIAVEYNEIMDTTVVPLITFPIENPLTNTLTFDPANCYWSDWKTYIAAYVIADANETLPNVDVHVTGGKDVVGNEHEPYDAADLFSIDTENPSVVSVTPSTSIINDGDAGTGTFKLTIIFSENMQIGSMPVISFPVEDALANTLTENDTATWLNETTFEANYDVSDANELLNAIDVTITTLVDEAGNDMAQFDAADNFSIDMENPSVVSVTPSVSVITDAQIGVEAFTLTVTFDQSMDTSEKFSVTFPIENPFASTLAYNSNASAWTSQIVYEAKYDVTDAQEILSDIDLEVATVCTDLAGNIQVAFYEADKFSIDMDNTGVAGVDENGIRVYPNPVGSGAMLYVEVAQVKEGAVLQLLNAQGRVVIAQQLTNQKSSIALASLPAGLYLLRVGGVEKEFSHSVLILGN